MRTLEDIADDLKTILTEKVRSVHFIPGKTMPEGPEGPEGNGDLRALGGSSLPAAILLPEEGGYRNGNAVRTQKIRLLLVDSFTAGGDSRASSVWSLAEQVRLLFPDSGRMIQDVFYLPVSAGPANGVLFAGHAVYEIELLLQQ